MAEPTARAPDPDDEPTEEAVHAALADTPRGALALAFLTTALLIAGWLFVYLFVFLPRGEVG
jgi:hypothetical protein